MVFFHVKYVSLIVVFIIKVILHTIFIFILVILSGIGSPGVFQGVRLSRELADGSVFQPEVVDEVVQVVRHSHLD